MNKTNVTLAVDLSSWSFITVADLTQLHSCDMMSHLFKESLQEGMKLQKEVLAGATVVIQKKQRRKIGRKP